MKYRLVNGETIRTIRAIKASATVIAAGDLVAISSGLIIKAVAASAAIAWCPAGGADGETVVEITVGNDFVLETTAESAFTVAYKGGEYDINNDGTQTINWDASVTDVLKIDISENAGTLLSADNIRVRINKPLF